MGNLNLPPVQYVRIQRVCSDSWMTFKLDRPVNGEDLESHLAEIVPEWERNGCATEMDPEYDYENEIPFAEPWRFPEWDDRVWEGPCFL